MHTSIDIGGTYTKILTSSSYNQIKETGRTSFKTSKVFKNGIKDIFNYINSLSIDIESIGITLAGRISQDKTKLVSTNHLSDWVDKDIIEVFKQKYNCEVYIENDAIAQGFAEYYYSTQKQNFLYLVWGTGIGGELFLGGDNQSLDREYIRETEKIIGGAQLVSKYGDDLSVISKLDWQDIISDFEKLIYKLQNKYSIDDVIIAGGVVERQRSLIEELITDKSIIVSPIIENIGFYGGLAIIKHNKT